jgi:hypothetical protein
MMGGDGRNFNEGEGREGEVSGDFLIIICLVQKIGGEGRCFNCIYVWFRKGGERF